MAWHVRSAGRLDEMSQGKRSLRIEIQQDGDIVLYIDHDGVEIEDAEGNKAKVEFCSTAGGGGRSPHTRKALAQLFEAMKRDARETKEGIPPFPTYLTAAMAEDTS